MADDLQQNGGSAEDVAAARAGAFDTLLKVAAAFYRAGAAASAERIKELEVALAKANEPEWFFGHAGAPYLSLDKAVAALVDPYRGPLTQLVEVKTARPAQTLWGVARILTEELDKARGCKDPWVFTTCATEAEARALLKETDQ